MDVNETLRELRELIKSFRAADSAWEEATVATAALERFEALDEWLTDRHGMLPDDWQWAARKAVVVQREG